MNIQLSVGMAPNPRTWPLFDGAVKPDGIDLIMSPVHASELFWRQLRFADFDLSDMSFSSLLIAIAHGDKRWIGLPIFTTRRLFHTRILVRRDAGIDAPADLKGKRVGVPEYQQTAALWTRGVLQHEFGVEPKDMEFWMERNPEHSHGGATEFKAPPGVTIHQIPIGKDIGSMMLSGELQATLLYIVNQNLVDRSSADLWNHPEIRFLFPDPRAEGIRYYNKTGPIRSTTAWRSNGKSPSGILGRFLICIKPSSAPMLLPMSKGWNISITTSRRVASRRKQGRRSWLRCSNMVLKPTGGYWKQRRSILLNRV